MAYECRDGLEFVARIQHDTAWLFLPGMTRHLERTPSNWGTEYALENSTLRIEGQTARLQLENVIRECVNNRRHAIWEHAKLNGAHFRATGNEPGWNMEIYSDSIKLVLDYGASTERFATPAPIEDATAHRTTYESVNDSHRLTVTLEGGGCSDTMSGEEFEVSVTVTLGERVLRGCGRALH
jgi:uncharacterized membrane protein